MAGGLCVEYKHFSQEPLVAQAQSRNPSVPEKTTYQYIHTTEQIRWRLLLEARTLRAMAAV